MDLNSAILAANEGHHIRDERTMRAGWTIRWVPESKLLYFFDPAGEKQHKVMFNDGHRASFQWSIVQ